LTGKSALYTKFYQYRSYMKVNWNYL